MAYTRTTWVDGSSPGITANNLNKIEQGLVDAHAHMALTANNPHGTTASQVGALPIAGGTMTGQITGLNDRYWFGGAGNFAFHARNSAIVGLESLVFSDVNDHTHEGVFFLKNNASDNSTNVTDYSRLYVDRFGSGYIDTRRIYTDAESVIKSSSKIQAAGSTGYVQAGASSSDANSKMVLSRTDTTITNLKELEVRSDYSWFAGDLKVNGSMLIGNATPYTMANNTSQGNVTYGTWSPSGGNSYDLYIQI